MGAPAGMTTDFGVNLSIGMLSYGERAEIVLPIATNDGGLGPASLCADAVSAWLAAGPQAALLACMSSDCQITFLSAQGWVNGVVPVRQDFPLATYPGTRAAGAMPTSVAGLIAFYANPADLVAGQRMLVGKTMIPGVAQADSAGDTIVAGLQTNLQTLGQNLLDGWITGLGGGNWYRVNSSEGLAGVPVIRNSICVARGYFATQRRRLLPH